MEDCLQQNCSLRSFACSEGPALGQNTHDYDDDYDRLLCSRPWKECCNFRLLSLDAGLTINLSSAVDFSLSTVGSKCATVVQSRGFV